ncbi:ribonuclease-3 family protein [Paenibacillus polysaccharolyticus]|uniref:Mini-ribonuclease 3 n=1 Tax=Paenibacillus polysaccharolyticus TaxID=582692 RepID=A0A1G5LH44_9BACL|nr:ribonuclease III domain-containing protein [Paenibacillus polysaccharolyticus]SCZ12237.1 ribonuclease-3 family protein [Paenibacillus polysaccharolyticus]
MSGEKENVLSGSVERNEQAKQVVTNNQVNELEGGWFPYPPSRPARLIPPIALAYIGDAVYEVAVRQYLLSKANMRPNHLHRSATKLVSAKAQSRILTSIEAELKEEEQDVVRQGRNAKSGSVPKNADVLEYRHATAFECLIGYLYSSSQHDRMIQLIGLGIELAEQASASTSK